MARKIETLVALAILGASPFSSWFGADKLKHFLMSALVQSTAFSAARAVGLQRPNAQVIGGVSTMSVGIWKEVHDQRRGRPFSVQDVAWDAAGGVAAGALLNGTR